MIAKQMDVRSNIKKYFDIAYAGETVIVPRKDNKNIVIISEEEYNRLMQAKRIETYAGAVAEKRSKKGSARDSDKIRTFNLRKLKKIQSMKDNWNGNGAPAIPVSLIKKVTKLVNELEIQPEIFPTALGTIQLEYDNSRRDHMEIEIGLSDIAEIFIVSFSGEEKEESIAVLGSAINERVGNFYG